MLLQSTPYWWGIQRCTLYGNATHIDSCTLQLWNEQQCLDLALFCCHHDDVIVRFPLINAEQCQVAADPQTKTEDLGCESACRLLSPYIHHLNEYTHIHTLSFILMSRGVAMRVRGPCPQSLNEWIF